MLLVQQGPHPFVLLALTLCNGMDERQGELPFAQVVAGGFAYHLVFEIVEYVVFNLETEAQLFAKLPQPLYIGFAGSGRQGAHLHAGIEERCRLAANYLEIGILVKAMFPGIGELVYLPASQLATQHTQTGNDGHLVGPHRTGQGTRHEIVARQHRNAVVVQMVDRRQPPAFLRLVYHIVVYQAGVVQQLQRGGGIDCFAWYRAEQFCAQQYQNRPYLLAFTLEIGVDYLVHQGTVRMQCLGKGLIQ